MGTLKPQSNGPSYINTMIGTLAVDGWVVTFGTVRRGLGGLRPAQSLLTLPNVTAHPSTATNEPTSDYSMRLTTGELVWLAIQLDNIIQCTVTAKYFASHRPIFRFSASSCLVWALRRSNTCYICSRSVCMPIQVDVWIIGKLWEIFGKHLRHSV